MASLPPVTDKKREDLRRGLSDGSRMKTPWPVRLRQLDKTVGDLLELVGVWADHDPVLFL